MPHVVNDKCQDCRFTDCVTTCPVSCFHGSDTRVFINPEACIDCGACIPACPVHAILDALDLSAKEEYVAELNAASWKLHPVVRTKLPPLATADARRKELGC